MINILCLICEILNNISERKDVVLPCLFRIHPDAQHLWGMDYITTKLYK